MNSVAGCTIVMAIVTAQPGQEKDKNKKNKKPLTPEAFNKFLRWLDADRDLAVSKYEEIRKKLIRYFVHKGCVDPDELFNETIDRVVRKLDDGARYSNPIAICFGVAHNVWREFVKKPPIDPLGDLDIPAPDPDNSDSHEQKLQCLDSCLGKIPETDRDLISRYHGAEGGDKIETRKRLAAEQGGDNVLRIRTFRIRTRLRICVEECLKRRVN